MKVARVLWRSVVGLAVTGVGGYLSMSDLETTVLTASMILGIALLAVGVSILAGALD